MFSQTTEYALRAMVHLAANNDAAQTNSQIAKGTQVPPHYLSKVLQSLAKAGLVHPQRGLHGGFTLVQSPSRITIYDVIQAVEPIKRISVCPLGLAAHGAVLCPLHHRLDNAMEHVERSFRETTLAEVLAEPSSSKPLCGP